MIKIFFTGRELIVLDILPRGSKFDRLYFVDYIFPDLKRENVNFHCQIPAGDFWVHIDLSIFDTFAKPCFASIYRPIRKLNTFTITTRIRIVEFQITECEPGEYCSVTLSTEIHTEGEPLERKKRQYGGHRGGVA
jgi:hypothetical protein